MKHSFFLIVLLLIYVQAKSQTIEIGQDALSLKTIVEWSTNNQNMPDSYGRYPSFKVSCNVVYKNGRIVDIVQCYQNQFYIDLKRPVDFCNHYIIVDNKLSYILTKYKNVPVEEIRNIYNKKYEDQIVNDYYFESDYNHFSKIYIDKSGLSTIEYRRTSFENITAKVIDKIEAKKKLKKEKEFEQQQRDYNSKIYLVSETDNYKMELQNEQDFKRVFVNSCNQYFLRSSSNDLNAGVLLDSIFKNPIYVTNGDERLIEIIINKNGSVNNSILNFSKSTYNKTPVYAKVYLKLNVRYTIENLTVWYDKNNEKIFSILKNKECIYNRTETSTRREAVWELTYEKMKPFITRASNDIKIKIDSLYNQVNYLKDNKTNTSKQEIKEIKVRINNLKQIDRFNFTCVIGRLGYMFLDNNYVPSPNVIASDGMDYTYVIEIKPYE